MDRATAITALNRLHLAQNRFYSGDGDRSELAALLRPDVIWVVPGASEIDAGTYRSVGEVLDYFERRRACSHNSMRVIRRDALVGNCNLVAAVTDGVRIFGGEIVSWRTVELYRITANRVSACWLLPLDTDSFDRS